MRKSTALVFIAMLLLSIAPASAQGGPVGALKQFFQYVADNNDAAAWRSLTAASKKGIPHMTWLEASKNDPNVKESDVVQLFNDEDSKVLKVFFDSLRSSLDIPALLKDGKFTETDYQGKKVVLVEGAQKSAYVMVDEGGWKVGLYETLQISK